MVTVAYLPTYDELVAMLQLGKMTGEDVQKVPIVLISFSLSMSHTQAVEICIDGSLRMKDLLRECLAERQTKTN